MPSHTPKQARVMSAIAHGWRPSGLKIPVKVAKEFHEADKGKKWGAKMAGGGAPQAPWYERNAVRSLNYRGFVNSSVPGRTDRHPVKVGAGAYIVPADTVSAIGQNNSLAGGKILNNMFGSSSRFSSRLRVPKFADGGAVPIVVAGGEYAIPPEIVARIGGGDIKKGHDILDRWVLAVRKKHVAKLKSLPKPKK